MNRREELKEQVRSLDWDEISVTDEGLQCAVKTVQGIPFAFTDDYKIVVFCDGDGLFRTDEVIGCVYGSGNYSDYDVARVIAVLADTQLDNVPLSDIRSSVVNAGSQVDFTPKARAETEDTDWQAVYDGLEAYIRAVQSLNQTLTVTPLYISLDR